mgnify:CR=1 FL=1
MDFGAFLQSLGQSAGRSRLERESRQKEQEENILKMLQAGFIQSPQPQQGALTLFDRLNQGLNYSPEMDPAPIFELAGHHPSKVAEAQRLHEAEENQKRYKHDKELIGTQHDNAIERLKAEGKYVTKDLRDIQNKIETVEAQINLARKNNDFEALPKLLKDEEELRRMELEIKRMTFKETEETHEGKMSALQFMNSDEGKEFTRMQRILGLTKDFQALAQERYTFIESDGEIIANDKFTGESRKVHTVSKDPTEQLMTKINQLFILVANGMEAGGDWDDILETPQFKAVVRDIVSGGAIAEATANVLGGEGDEGEDDSMTADVSEDGEITVPEESDPVEPKQRRPIMSPQGIPLGGYYPDEMAGEQMVNAIKEYLLKNLNMFDPETHQGKMLKRTFNSPVLQGLKDE